MFNNGYNGFYPYQSAGLKTGLFSSIKGKFNWSSLLNNTQKTLNIIRKNDQLLVFIGIVLGMNLIMQISGSMAIYYFTYVVGKESLFSVYQAFAGIAEISGLVLLPILTKKIGREDVFKFGSILPIAGFLLLFVALNFLFSLFPDMYNVKSSVDNFNISLLVPVTNIPIILIPF